MAIGRLASTAIAGIQLLLLAQQTLGNLTGSGTITYHDFQSLPMNLLANNPPSCGMPYAQLDVTRITAVQQMDKSTDCGQCVKVCNAEDTSKYVYVLAVDTGGRGLDLSKPSFAKLFNIDDGVGPAQWEPVDSSHCSGIWSNGGQGSGNDYQGAHVDNTSPPASTEKAVVSSPPAPAPAAPSSTTTPPQPVAAVVAAAPATSATDVRPTVPLSMPRTSSSQHQPAADTGIQRDVGSSVDDSTTTAIVASSSEKYSSESSDLLGFEGVAHGAENSSASSLDEEPESLSHETEDSETSGSLATGLALSTLLLCALAWL